MIYVTTKSLTLVEQKLPNCSCIITRGMAWCDWKTSHKEYANCQVHWKKSAFKKQVPTWNLIMYICFRILMLTFKFSFSILINFDFKNRFLCSRRNMCVYTHTHTQELNFPSLLYLHEELRNLMRQQLTFIEHLPCERHFGFIIFTFTTVLCRLYQCTHFTG